MRVLMFGHRQRVGKDTAARFAMNYLRTRTRVSCCRMSFGDEIKDLAFQMYKSVGLQDGMYYEEHPELKDVILPAVGKSPRQLWIDLGLKGREIWPYTWPEMAFQKIDAAVAICSDLRDFSEIEYGQKFDAVFVRINRPTEKKAYDGIDDKLDTFKGWHFDLMNDSDLKTFNSHVVNIVQQCLRKWNLA